MSQEKIRHDLLEEKLNLLRSMFALASTQMQTIEQDDPEALLQVLLERERLMKQVDALDLRAREEGFGPFIGKGSEGSRLLRAIVQIDAQTKTHAQAMLETYRADVKQAKEDMRALEAYTLAYSDIDEPQYVDQLM